MNSEVSKANKLLKQVGDILSNIKDDTAQDSAIRLMNASTTLAQWADEIKRDADLINKYRNESETK